MSEPTSTTPAGDSDNGELPVGFAQFIVSLASSAMVHLGEVADPASGKPTVDLTLARHTIDVLALLKEKTKGNLDEDEDKLLDAVLFDLRQKFLDASKA